MKLFTTTLVGLAVALSGTFALASDDSVKEKEVTIGINDAFIPGGFDSESDAYVVVNGLFPNGCYAWNRAEVNKDVEPNIHEVRSVATVRQTMCIMVLVPFTKELHLGQLEAGDHTIRFMNGDGTFIERNLHVEE